MKLSGGRVIDHLRERPENLHEALQVVSSVTHDIVTASLDRGASGIFFVTQCARHDLLSDQKNQEFGAAYDLPVLEAADAFRFTRSTGTTGELLHHLLMARRRADAVLSGASTIRRLCPEARQRPPLRLRTPSPRRQAGA